MLSATAKKAAKQPVQTPSTNRASGDARGAGARTSANSKVDNTLNALVDTALAEPDVGLTKSFMMGGGAGIAVGAMGAAVGAALTVPLAPLAAGAGLVALGAGFVTACLTYMRDGTEARKRAMRELAEEIMDRIPLANSHELQGMLNELQKAKSQFKKCDSELLFYKVFATVQSALLQRNAAAMRDTSEAIQLL